MRAQRHRRLPGLRLYAVLIPRNASRPVRPSQFRHAGFGCPRGEANRPIPYRFHMGQRRARTPLAGPAKAEALPRMGEAFRTLCKPAAFRNSPCDLTFDFTIFANDFS